MPLKITAPIVLGLAARFLITNLLLPVNPNRSPESEAFLDGFWQGSLLHLVTADFQEYAPVVYGILAIKLIVTHVLNDDMAQSVVTCTGIAIGGLATELLVVALGGDPDTRKPERTAHGHERSERTRTRREEARRSTHTHAHTRARTPVQDYREVIRSGEQSDRSRTQQSLRPQSRMESVMSLATSYDSYLDLEGRSPQEIEIAKLRREASLADANRRRCKEERKWALSQGNQARASQLEWQMKRYAALSESYHKEADKRVIQASRGGSVPPNGLGNGIGNGIGNGLANGSARMHGALSTHAGPSHIPPSSRITIDDEDDLYVP